jgi:phospholipid-binding lipoprotein MlaA
MVVPARARTSVHNALSNLGEPVIFANDLLQGKTDDAGQSLARFMLNSSLGGLGLFDPATSLGHPYHTNDFGLTLAHYGAGAGPYLVLPIFGPSNPRDAVGFGVDSFVLDPVAYIAPTDVRLGLAAARGIDTRYRFGPALDDLKANSLDFYATVRTVSQQHRAAQVSGTSPGANQAYEDIFNENFDDQPEQQPAKPSD